LAASRDGLNSRPAKDKHFCRTGGQKRLEMSIDLPRYFGTFSPPFNRILMKTYLPKVDVDQRKWHVIDANGAVLGRLAVQIANVLRGKNKPVFTSHLDAGDFVVVINAEKVSLTGKKETEKFFMTYSGWKGGEKYKSVAQVRAKNPEELITHAVKGMIPKNRLGRQLMTKLKVYKGGQHPHSAQQPATLAHKN
jgi:large subunit ribosomal protein L13